MSFGPLLSEDLASSDLSYLSDIEEEESQSASFSPSASISGSSALNSSQLDTSSLQSEVGCCTLDWRAEMTPGTVSLIYFLIVSKRPHDI